MSTFDFDILKTQDKTEETEVKMMTMINVSTQKGKTYNYF